MNNHPLTSRPHFPPASDTILTSSNLRSRLSSFLPTLAAANDELDTLRREGRLAERDIENIGSGGDDDDDDDDDVERGPYIEMV